LRGWIEGVRDDTATVEDGIDIKYSDVQSGLVRSVPSGAGARRGGCGWTGRVGGLLGLEADCLGIWLLGQVRDWRSRSVGLVGG
jgi:hypothetical protein